MEFYLNKDVGGLGLSGEAQEIMPTRVIYQVLQSTGIVLWKVLASAAHRLKWERYKD